MKPEILPCSAKISKISHLGLVSLKFNREVILTETFNETTVDIYVQPADSLDLDDFNLTWEVDSITD